MLPTQVEQQERWRTLGHWQDCLRDRLANMTSTRDEPIQADVALSCRSVTTSPFQSPTSIASQVSNIQIGLPTSRGSTQHCHCLSVCLLFVCLRLLFVWRTHSDSCLCFPVLSCPVLYCTALHCAVLSCSLLYVQLLSFDAYAA